MRADIQDWYTNIYLSLKEVREYCKIGEGANTCVWLVAGEKGFECCSMHRPPSLVNKWRAGDTEAKRDGCEKVKNFSPSEHGIGEVKF